MLYHGQPVRLFADDSADTEAFYLDAAGNVNLSVVRNAAGEITGVESITAQKAQEYQDAFFAEELGGSFPKEQDIAKVQEGVQVVPDQYEAYQPFGLTYSAADESASALWTDEAGTINLAVIRDASAQITGIDTITDERAQEYLVSANAPIIDVDRLEAELEAKMRALYPNGME